jgi:TolB-like protein
MSTSKKITTFGILILFLMILSSAFLFSQEDKDRRTTIAVVYFDNNVMMKDKDRFEPLKKGFADMLITELSKINKFRVVERQRIQNIMDEFELSKQQGLVDEATKTRLGKFLGAQLILLGGFSGFKEEQFRVDARIIQTETGLTVSTCEITDEFESLFTIVKEVAKKVVEDLKIDLSSLEKKELGRSVKGTGEELLKYSKALSIQDKARQEERFGSKDKAKELYIEAKKLYDEAFALNNEYTLAKEKSDEINKIFAEMEKGIDRDPPQIILASAGDGGTGLTTSEATHKLIGYSSDFSGVTDIVVNGVKAVLEEASDKDAKKYNLKPGKVVKFAAEIPLTLGENTIEISGKDVLGNFGSQHFTVKRFGEKIVEKTPNYTEPSFSLPKVYAVIVGVSKYKNSKFNLNYADADAKLFYDFLKSPSGGAIPDDRIKLITNEEANRPTVLKYIQKVFKEANKEDMIIFYFAGHGWAEGQTMYFLSNEVEMDNLIGTAVSQTDIENAVKVSKARRAIMVMDACHAGATKINFLASRDIDVSNKLILEIAQSSEGLRIITAAGVNQQSKEDVRWGGGHGAFTWYFIEGAKGAADVNKDKVVTLREVFDYVDQKVNEATEGNQRPDREGDLDIPMSVIK